MDPDTLSLKQWVKLAAEWDYIRELKNNDFKNNLSEVLVKLLQEVLGKKTQ